MKPLRVLLSILLLVSGVRAARAEGEDRVTAQVRAFYQWYLPLLESAQDDHIFKRHRKEMARYLTAHLMAKLARIPADTQEGDYFVESLDSDREWVKNLAVRNVKIDAKGRATAEVLLSGGTAAKVSVKLTLVLEGGTYKISAVENLPIWGDTASAQLRAFYAQYLHYRAYATTDETLTGREDVREGFTGAGFQKATAKGADDAKVDYLLQTTDLDSQWEDHIEVKSAEITPDGSRGTAEVLLTGEKIPKAHVKVSLKKEKDVFKIDGVEKIND